MNISFYIARRYLFSKKSYNAINLISGVSVLGVFVGSAALIIILSAFNGLEKVILSMYNTFTPEIVIEPVAGKTYDPALVYQTQLNKDPRVFTVTEVLQANAWVRYGDAESPTLIKGVSDEFIKGKKVDSVMISGSFLFKKREMELAVIGATAQAYLGVNINDDFRNLEIYTPRKGKVSTVNPGENFNVFAIHPAGVFAVQQKFDEVILVPLSFARKLFDEETVVSAMEVTLKNKDDIAGFQEDIQHKLGSGFRVKNRSEQDQALYKTLNVEKISIYIILTFVLIIAIFNIVGSLTMLVIDKRDDITILSSIGAGSSLIRAIFFTEGMMIAMAGCVTGMLAGLLFSVGQLHFGWIKMEADTITEAYPISIKWLDFLLVFITVGIIAAISSAISSRLSIRHLDTLAKTD